MTNLPDDVRDLLTAIRDALDVPLPADPIGDEWTYRRLLESRILVVGASLRGLLADEAPDVRFDAAYIRKGIITYPATYPTTEAPTGKDTDTADQAAAGESTQADEPCSTSWAHLPHDGCAGISATGTCAGGCGTVEWARDETTGRRECPYCMTNAPEPQAASASPDCDRCEDSGLDPDAYTEEPGSDGQVRYVAEPCGECDKGRALAPAPAAEPSRWVYRAERTETPRPDYAYSFGTRPASAGPADRLAIEVAAGVRVEHTYHGLITVWVWPQRDNEHYRLPVPDHAERYLYPAGQPSEPVSCANPTCIRREHLVSAVAAGWEDDGGRWLCPQCAADAADRREFLDSLPDETERQP